MRHVIVRYTVKADRAEENEQLVRAVYDELHSTEPAGLSYATLKLDDGISFVHIAATEDGRNPLATVAAFMALSLIGLFNIAGSFASGWAIGRWRMKSVLSLLYASRALAVLVFVFAPKTTTTFLSGTW